MQEKTYYKFLLILLLVVGQYYTLGHAIDHQIDGGESHCAACVLNDNFQSSIKSDTQQFPVQQNHQLEHDLFNLEYANHYQFSNHIRAPPFKP